MLIKPKKNRKKGFTLVELIIVVAVIAILAAVAIPNFLAVQAQAKKGVDIANASTIAGVINTYNAMQQDSSKWYKTSPATWATLTNTTTYPSLNGMLPNLTGGTGANQAAWQGAACALITVDGTTGVAVVNTSLS